MRKIILIVVAVLLLTYAGALAIPIDPDEQRPGTRLSGTVVNDSQPDWSFLEERQKVYLQTSTWYGIPHSVTTISFVVDDELYIPCGWCDSKQWPRYVAEDPNVTVKIGERLFERRAVRVNDAAMVRRVLAVGEHEDLPGVVLYHMAAR